MAHLVTQDRKVVELKLIQQLEEKLTSKEVFDVMKCDESGTSLLHVACDMEMLQLAEQLLENQADVNCQDSLGRTPLMIAAHRGSCVILNLLLSRGAKLDILDKYGFSAALHAVYSGNSQIFDLLVGKERETTDGLWSGTFLGELSPLALASALNKAELVKHLLDNYPHHVSKPVSKSGMSPLMLGICGGSSETVELLAKGGDLHTTSRAGLSSVGYARRLSFPLLTFNIPDIRVEEEGRCQCKRKAHPLTPNIYISPTKRAHSTKWAFDWIKSSMKRKRSKSLGSRKNKENIDNKPEKDDENVLKSIFLLAKIEQYLPLFEEQEINFKTFLTMNDEDLLSIGISKSSVRLKILNLIDHYRKIFDSH